MLEELQPLITSTTESFTAIAEVMKANMVTNNQIASRKAYNSIQVRTSITDTSMVWQIVSGGEASDYIMTLEYGARPHWAPIAPLIQWVKDKGLANTEAKAKSIAYAVRKKIADEGTNVYKMQSLGYQPYTINSAISEQGVAMMKEDITKEVAKVTTKKAVEAFLQTLKGRRV